jgi:hypothetical protein
VKPTSPHLETLEEIKRDCIPGGLVEMFREKRMEAACYILWDATDRHESYDPDPSL